ncbi:MAG: hypothetical protein ACKOF9_04465 [Burkholderiales bacterium]
MNSARRFCFATSNAKWWCSLILSLFVIVGCGPGTGGTGTGQTSSAMDFFGAAPANICTTGPASALACPQPTNPGTVGAVIPPSAANGTDGVFFSTTEGADINLGLTGNRANLNDRCLSLNFEGEWGVVGTSEPRFFGQYATGSNTPPTLSTLTVQATGPDNKSLSLTLRDTNNRVVLGPVTLRRVLVPTNNPAACNR